SFGKEQIEGVHVSNRQTQRINLDVARYRTMDAPQIDHQFAIDVNPDVIIAREGEHFPPAIEKRGVRFEGEVEVIRTAFITEARAINRKERAAAEAENA